MKTVENSVFFLKAVKISEKNWKKVTTGEKIEKQWKIVENNEKRQIVKTLKHGAKRWTNCEKGYKPQTKIITNCENGYISKKMVKNDKKKDEKIVKNNLKKQ